MGHRNFYKVRQSVYLAALLQRCLTASKVNRQRKTRTKQNTASDVQSSRCERCCEQFFFRLWRYRNPTPQLSKFGVFRVPSHAAFPSDEENSHFSTVRRPKNIVREKLVKNLSFLLFSQLIPQIAIPKSEWKHTSRRFPCSAVVCKCVAGYPDRKLILADPKPGPKIFTIPEPQSGAPVADRDGNLVLGEQDKKITTTATEPRWN